jgi:hypothetical protein
MNSILFLIVLGVKRPVNAELVVGALIACFLLSVLGFILILITWQNDQHAQKPITPPSSLDKANAFFGSKPKPQLPPQRIAGNGVGKIGQAVGITIVTVGAVGVALAFIINSIPGTPSSATIQSANASTDYLQVRQYHDPEVKLGAVEVTNVGRESIVISDVRFNNRPQCNASELITAMENAKAHQNDPPDPTVTGMAALQKFQEWAGLMVLMGKNVHLPLALDIGQEAVVYSNCSDLGKVLDSVVTTNFGTLPFTWR